jgi:hypothetical protein
VQWAVRRHRKAAIAHIAITFYRSSRLILPYNPEGF